MFLHLSFELGMKEAESLPSFLAEVVWDPGLGSSLSLLLNLHSVALFSSKLESGKIRFYGPSVKYKSEPYPRGERIFPSKNGLVGLGL